MKYKLKELDYLDKHYGENFAKLCRSLFPSILEHEGMLQKIITDIFADSHSIYDDIINNDDVDNFRDYIFSIYERMVRREKAEREGTLKTPEQLMEEAGYILLPECESEDDIQLFKKYYQKEEELCTFCGGRLQDCRVWFAIKNDAIDPDAEKYNRANFPFPERQDEYGTSVISIQFTRGKHAYLSIKNRYNHTVDNPDATFGNDLENINPGLTDAFVNTYNLNLANGNSKDFDLEDYVRADDNKLYRYNSNVYGNAYYCENNIVITDGKPVKYDQSRYLFIDDNILDLSSKEFLKDNAFAKSIGKIKSVDIKNNKEDKTRIVTITPEEGEPVEIIIDKHNALLSYSNANVEEIGADFLRHSMSIKNIDLPNVKEVGYCFLRAARNLETLKLPKIEEVGDAFLENAESLENINFPNLKTAGKYFMSNAKYIRNVNLPKLKIAKNDFLSNAFYLESISLPNLKIIEDGFLANAELIEEVDLPRVESIGDRFMYACNGIERINLPSVKKVRNKFLYNSMKLKEINMPNVEEFGLDCLTRCENLESIDFPKVQKTGNYFMTNAKSILNVNMPELLSAGIGLFTHSRKLKSISLPKVKSLGGNFISNAESLESVYLPELESAGQDFLFETKVLKSISLPKLKKAPIEFMTKAYELKTADFPMLEMTYFGALTDCEKLESINVPMLNFAGDRFLMNAKSLKEISLPKIYNIRDDFMTNAVSLEKIYMPIVQYYCSNFLTNARAIKEANIREGYIPDYIAEAVFENNKPKKASLETSKESSDSLVNNGPTNE